MSIKQKIYNNLKQKLEYDLLQAKESYNSTHEHATDDGIKQESKYDTRAIESSYLAGAQKKRVDELELELGLLEKTKIKDENDNEEVLIGSLVELEFNGKIINYFLCSACGGSIINIDNKTIMVVTPFSPLGDAMLSLGQGDSFEIETPKGNREYKIINIR